MPTKLTAYSQEVLAQARETGATILDTPAFQHLSKFEEWSQVRFSSLSSHPRTSLPIESFCHLHSPYPECVGIRITQSTEAAAAEKAAAALSPERFLAKAEQQVGDGVLPPEFLDDARRGIRVLGTPADIYKNLMGGKPFSFFISSNHFHFFSSLINAEIDDSSSLETAANTYFFRPHGIPTPEASDLEAQRREILVSSGSSLTPYLAAIRALVKPGQYVLLPQGSFEVLIAGAATSGGTPIVINTEKSGFKLSARDLELEVQRRGAEHIGCVLLVSPCGVTGESYTNSELKALAAVAIRHNLFIICDELYSDLGHKGGPAHRSLASISLRMRGKRHRMHDRVVTIQGTSKNVDMENGAILTFTTCGNHRIIAALREEAARKGFLPTFWQEAAFPEVLRLRAEQRENEAYVYARGKEILRAEVDWISRTLGAGLKKGAAPGEKNAAVCIFGKLTSGFFGCVGLSAALFEKVGVHNSLELSKYLFQATGVSSRALDGMGMSKIGGYIPIRVNISSPTLRIAFERIQGLLQEILEGKAPHFSEFLESQEEGVPSAGRGVYGA